MTKTGGGPVYVEVLVGEEGGGREEGGKGEVKRPAEVVLEDALPEGRGEIILLRTMVNNMGSPANVHLVAHPVGPVIPEVNQQHAGNPGPHGRGVQLVDWVVLVYIDIGIQGNSLEYQEVQQLLQDPGSQGSRHVIEPGQGPGGLSPGRIRHAINHDSFGVLNRGSQGLILVKEGDEEPLQNNGDQEQREGVLGVVCHRLQGGKAGGGRVHQVEQGPNPLGNSGRVRGDLKYHRCCRRSRRRQEAGGRRRQEAGGRRRKEKELNRLKSFWYLWCLAATISSYFWVLCRVPGVGF